jgi:aryl-alcohol dehydrogenase-like predicted oxidoreductase
MTSAAESQVSQFQLAEDLSTCRILNGMWQVSGAHGPIESREAISQMFDYVQAGFTTWDLADHYGPAEDFVGEFLNQWVATQGKEALQKVQTFTKWVPRPGDMPRRVVEANLDRSRRRMGVESLDLLQFHWWDYRNRSYIEALKHMVDLKAEGKIKHLALTNFDTDHLANLLDQGIPIVSNQVQFSLIDQRPLVKMVPYCKANEVSLLAYGTLCGGLLSDKYLNKPEPPYRDLNTASLQKYKRMIDAWGGWNLFQRLLGVLDTIAQKYQVSIANVAVRSILEQPAVAGTIVGARLGVSEHLENNRKVFGFSLDEIDRAQIQDILSQSKDLLRMIGDCGDEYRH